MDRQNTTGLRRGLRRLRRQLGLEDPLSDDGRVTDRRTGGWTGAARLPSTAFTVGFSAVALTVGLAASGVMAPGEGDTRELRSQLAEVRDQVHHLRGQLAIQELEVERLTEIQGFSTEYDIPADLAGRIYDTALAEGLRPEVAFRLVRIESSFRKRAVSAKGAVGYTQIKPSTARWMEPGLTEADLFDTGTNLRLGFRYLRMLLDRYEDDLRLALLAYNQGPGRVGKLLAMGRDPANGYARSVMSGGE